MTIEKLIRILSALPLGTPVEIAAQDSNQTTVDKVLYNARSRYVLLTSAEVKSFPHEKALP